MANLYFTLYPSLALNDATTLAWGGLEKCGGQID